MHKEIYILKSQRPEDYKSFENRIFNLSSAVIDGDEDPWNYEDDGQLFIAGLEFHPVKGLMITPNYQGWFNSDGSPSFHSAYLSLELKF